MLLCGQILFQGDNDFNQLHKISQIHGRMTSDRIPKYQAYVEKFKMKNVNTDALNEYPNKSNLESKIKPYVGHWEKDGQNKMLNLLLQLLDYNHLTRITAANACQHPWFHSDPLPQPPIGLSTFLFCIHFCFCFCFIVLFLFDLICVTPNNSKNKTQK